MKSRGPRPPLSPRSTRYCRDTDGADEASMTRPQYGNLLDSKLIRWRGQVRSLKQVGFDYVQTPAPFCFRWKSLGILVSSQGSKSETGTSSSPQKHTKSNARAGLFVTALLAPLMIERVAPPRMAGSFETPAPWDHKQGHQSREVQKCHVDGPDIFSPGRPFTTGPV